MADYEAYGPWVGGDDWRAWVGVYITTNNATTLAGRVESWVWSEYGTTSGNANIKGAAAWDSNSWSYGSATSISQNSWKKLKEVTFSVSKPKNNTTYKTAWAKAEGISGVYSGSSSQATVSVHIPQKTSYTVSYNANGGTGSMANSQKWYGEGLTLRTNTFTRANYTFKGWATSATGGVAYANGASYTANAAATLYAVWERTYTVPSAVTGLSLARTSDSQLKATWTNNSAVPREYTAVYVEMQTDGGQWVQVAKLGASATNYTWGGASANHQYRVRVRPYNPAGYGAYATSGYVYTTPAAPSSVVASVPSAGSVAVEVTSGAPWAGSHVVEVTADGGETWTQVGTVSGAGGTYTDTTPPAGTCQYRVRAVIGTLYSEWTYSAEIVTLCPPLAPTITQRPAAAIATDSTVTLAWTPNHPDGTAQAKAQVEVTVGGVATTIDINDSTTSVDLTSYAVTPQAVSVRVRTYGLYEEWGDWSSVVAFTAYIPPSVTIDTPAGDGDVVTALPVEIGWTATDSTGISAQTLRLYSADGRMLKSWQLDGAESSFYLDRSTYFLTNETDYRVSVSAIAGSSLQAVAERTFRVEYVGPAEPTADIWWSDDSLACSVTVGDGEDPSGELPVATEFYVVRVMGDTEWLVADGLSSSEQALDRLAPLGVEVTYRVVAVADSGAETAKDYVTIMDTASWAFGFGAGVAETVLLTSNSKQTESPKHEGQTYHFADGSANGLPVFYGYGEVETGLSWGFRVLRGVRDGDLADRLRALARQYPTCWARDPFGHRWFVVANWTFSQGHRSPVVEVSCSAEELRWEEA